MYILNLELSGRPWGLWEDGGTYRVAGSSLGRLRSGRGA